MYTKQIRYFLTLAEVGSFRRAAELLSISQPALSNSIKSLEAEYETELFERGPLGARLTEAGQTLHGFLRNAVDSIDRGKREVRLLRGGSKGHVAVGAPTGLIDQLLPEVIAAMGTASTSFSYQVHYGYLGDLLAKLRGWQLDVLLTTYWPEVQLGPDLVVERFAELGLSIYCRPQHPLARKRNVTLDDLAAAQWILPESQGMRSFVHEIFGAEGTGRLQRPIVHDYPPFMLRTIRRMDLLSLVPDYTAEEYVQNGSLRRVDYPAFGGRLSAGVLYLKDRHLTPALQRFIRVARETGTARYARKR